MRVTVRIAQESSTASNYVLGLKRKEKKYGEEIAAVCDENETRKKSRMSNNVHTQFREG